MGVACGPKGVLTITDNDRIEGSNLNRQFLFRGDNVGQQKSEAAAARATVMNSAIKINAMGTLVAPNTEDVFHEQVSFQWKNPDFLFRNPDFPIQNPDFLLKNVEFIIKCSVGLNRSGDHMVTIVSLNTIDFQCKIFIFQTTRLNSTSNPQRHPRKAAVELN